jgi:hypothetical protein
MRRLMIVSALSVELRPAVSGRKGLWPRLSAGVMKRCWCWGYSLIAVGFALKIL